MAEKYIDWRPVSLVYLTDKLNMNADYVGSTEGIIFSYNPLQNSIKGIASNQNTIAFLTDQTNISSLQITGIEESYNSNLTRNGLMTYNGFFVTNSALGTVNISNTAESPNTIFKLEFDNDFLYIISENINERKYLTFSSNGLSAFFDTLNSSISSQQQFKYTLNTDHNTLVLYCDVSGNGTYNVVTYDETNKTTSLRAVSSWSRDIYESFVFTLVNIDTRVKTNSLSSSYSVKYKTLLENDKTLYADLLIDNKKPFDNNFIFTIEPKADKEEEIEFRTEVKSNNIALKNLFNSDYQAAHTDSDFVKRKYQSIIMGNNIDVDYYNKPILTYEASSKQINLLPDQYTFFHFPYGASSIQLSAAGLIEAGAIAGTSPARSDRIWKAQEGYESRTNKGKSLGIQNGTWLCSWLQLSSTSCSTTRWVDRWYDGNNFNYKLALTALESNPYIIDVPSIMTLDPGVLYKYFHIGKQYSIQLIENINTSNKALEVKDWQNVTITNGTSSNINYTKFGESELTLNGSEYVELSSNDEFYPDYQLSLASWVYFDNWRNAPASQIVGNYYKGGYGINFDTGIQTDVVAFFDSYYGHLFIANTENKYLFDKAVPGLSGNTISDISFDLNGHIWVVDNVNCKAHVYDPINNLFIKAWQLPLSSNYILANHDSNNNFYAYDLSGKKFTKIDTNGIITHTQLSALSSTFLPVSSLSAFPLSGFFVDSQNHIQPYIGEIAFEDNNGNYYHYFGSNLVKNNEEYILHICGVDDIKVTGDDEFWYIKDKTLTKTDLNGNLLFSKTYPYLTEGRKQLTLTREVTKSGWQDFIWIMDGNSLIKYDSNGRFVKISKPKEFLNISEYKNRNRNLLNIKLSKKSTQYDILRESKIIEPGLLDNNYITAKWDYQYSTTTGTITMKHNTNYVDKGWHHIAMIIDTKKGSSILYFDGRAVDVKTFEPGVLKIKHNKNKFYIGKSNGFADTRAQGLLLDNEISMVGKLDDVRVYGYSLTDNDLIVLSRKKIEFVPVLFNVDIPIRQFLEEIDKLHTHRIPGFKSNIYNVRILNSSLNDELKQNIETAIRNVVKKITPIGSKLNKIVWD